MASRGTVLTLRTRNAVTLFILASQIQVRSNGALNWEVASNGAVLAWWARILCSRRRTNLALSGVFVHAEFVRGRHTCGARREVYLLTVGARVTKTFGRFKQSSRAVVTLITRNGNVGANRAVEADWAVNRHGRLSVTVLFRGTLDNFGVLVNCDRRVYGAIVASGTVQAVTNKVRAINEVVRAVFACGLLAIFTPVRRTLFLWLTLCSRELVTDETIWASFA